MSTNRRNFIKFVVAGAVASGCPIDSSLFATTPDSKPTVDGENNAICHQVRDGKVFSRPAVSARHDVIIVGGGMSGLTSAYLLQNRDFLLLEKEPHWGGNAYPMEYKGQVYATGSAFIWKDENAFPLAEEIGLKPLPVDNWDGSIIKGEFIPDTWGEGLSHLPYPARVRQSFARFKREMLAIDVRRREQELFGVSLASFLKGYAPEVKQWWDGYGPSNWGATSEDSAALLAIAEIQNFAGQDRSDLRHTWPGGIGALSKRLAETLQAKHADRMFTNATIVAVSPQRTEVHVTYAVDGAMTTVAAKAVIMATPKFITRRLVEGLPQAQSEAMHQIHYVPYAVVNLIFDKQVFNKGYDTWCPGNKFTDFIVADWVIRNDTGYKPKFNILTCYTPMAEDDRGYLLTEPSARKVAQTVLQDFQKLFPGSNVNPLEVHLYRRGHPMYMSAPKLFTEVQPLVRHPMERVFFANTDSQGPESSSSEAIVAAHRVVKEVEHRLAGKPGLPRESAAISG
jgi:protoporphyrinogen oxidase